MLKRFDFRQLSISKKFVFSIIFILWVPFILLFLVVSFYMSTSLRDKEREKNLENLKQVKGPIEYMIQDVEAMSLELLTDDQLQEYLVQGTQSTSEYYQRLKADIKYKFTLRIRARENISRLAIFTEDAAEFQFGAYLPEEKFNAFEEVKALRGQSLWLPARLENEYVEKRNRVYEVSLVRGINNYMALDQMVAYERINIPESYISDLYESMRDAETEELFIVNQQRQIISSVNKTLLGQTLTKHFYLNGIYEQSEGNIDFTNRRYISFCSIPGVDWYLVWIKQDTLPMDIKLIFMVIALSIGLTIVFTIIFYFIQRKYIIKPITQLSQDVGRFSDNHYSIAIHTTAEDEVGMLNQGVVNMGVYIQNLIEKELKSTIQAKEAQLQFLQSQINPHFLYNSLDAIRWMAIKEKQKDIAVQIEALSNLFKHALNGGKQLTTVKLEVQYLKDYICIQKNRFGEDLIVRLECDPQCEGFEVLNLLLQPLVENAIVHGVEKKVGVGSVNIKISYEENRLIYCVEDDGLGVDENKIKNILLNESLEESRAIGLKNINMRLKYKYGDACTLIFKSEVGVGTTVIISMPLEGGGVQ